MFFPLARAAPSRAPSTFLIAGARAGLGRSQNMAAHLIGTVSNNIRMHMNDQGGWDAQPILANLRVDNVVSEVFGTHCVQHTNVLMNHARPHANQDYVNLPDGQVTISQGNPLPGLAREIFKDQYWADGIAARLRAAALAGTGPKTITLRMHMSIPAAAHQPKHMTFNFVWT